MRIALEVLLEVEAISLKGRRCSYFILSSLIFSLSNFKACKNNELASLRRLGSFSPADDPITNLATQIAAKKQRMKRIFLVKKHSTSTTTVT